MSITAFSSEKVAQMNKEIDPSTMNNDDLMRNLGTGTKVYPSPVSIASPEIRPEKSLRRKKKKADGAKKQADESWPSPGSQFIADNSPKLITISEATSRTTSTSSSTMISPLSTKLRDLKVSSSSHKANQDSSDFNQNDNSEGANVAPIKRHTGGNSRWEAIQQINSRDPPICLSHFKLIKRIGYGDIGSVYVVELKGTNTFFAMKVMDRASLVSRNKLLRAQTEREILSLLDHPFLPTLYTHFETDKYCCLVMEYCCGGNLHSLRQKQPNKYFNEKNARFYATEVLLAIEYLHMLGIVYRDLKPENLLVRDEGHIMLSDFDLSLQCSVNPTLVNISSRSLDIEALQGCMKQKSFFPRILPKKSHKNKLDLSSGSKALPELMAEPTNARSMSFVGTHEYLAPEIIRGEGHGSAVDWWTFGIFLYELLYGTTPFKGSGNRATLFNVIGQPLMFPEMPNVSPAAKELINGLLMKEPQKRIGYRRGATEIKQHAFFDGVNWALVRSATPPHIPEPVNIEELVHKELLKAGKKEAKGASGKGKDDNLNFDFF